MINDANYAKSFNFLRKDLRILLFFSSLIYGIWAIRMAFWGSMSVIMILKSFHEPSLVTLQLLGFLALPFVTPMCICWMWESFYEKQYRKSLIYCALPITLYFFFTSVCFRITGFSWFQ